jgi:putative endonuclease
MTTEDYITDLCETYNLSRYTWVVYILRSVQNPNLTYVGMTNNIRRRLRQHNGCIKGGARYTSTNQPWKLAALIPNLEDKREALKVEYWAKAKHYRSKVGIPHDSVPRRVYLIQKTMERHGLLDVSYFDPDFADAAA